MSCMGRKSISRASCEISGSVSCTGAEDHSIGAGSLTRRFYSEVLGLRLMEDTPFALVFDAHGTMLRIQKVETLSPARYTTLGWHVGDIQEAVELLRKRGIVYARYPGLPQDEQGIWTTPAGSKIAWFTDPDGNLLSLTEIRQN
jgi:catechol 2,3-dioxygenase-like lactoylglutathione lyase family enzyme